MRGMHPGSRNETRLSASAPPRSSLASPTVVWGLAAALLLGPFAPIGCRKSPAGDASATATSRSFAATPLKLLRGARLYRSGTRALDAGETDRAILDLEQAATLAPAASEVQNHLGLAYWAGGRPEEAFSAFERAIALDCENEAALHNLRALERSANDASTLASPTPSATEGEHSSGR